MIALILPVLLVVVIALQQWRYDHMVTHLTNKIMAGGDPIAYAHIERSTTTKPTTTAPAVPTLANKPKDDDLVSIDELDPNTLYETLGGK